MMVAERAGIESAEQLAPAFLYTPYHVPGLLGRDPVPPVTQASVLLLSKIYQQLLVPFACSARAIPLESTTDTLMVAGLRPAVTLVATNERFG